MKHLSLFSLVLVLSFSAVALADDLNPPAWRGQPGSTWGEWVFSTNNPHEAPVAGFNPFGNPFMNAQPGFLQQWQPIFDGRQGVWPLSGVIEVDIPNNPVANPEKWIQVQITWKPQAAGEVPGIGAHIGPIGTPNPFNGALKSQQLLPDGWTYSIYDIVLTPNPSREIVRVDGAIMVDQLVIDTICIPEPLTLSLLAVGGLLLRRK